MLCDKLECSYGLLFRPGLALEHLELLALSLVPFSIMYGYSVVVIPIQSVLAPHNPYALKNSHAVWALSGSLVMSGVAQYLWGGATRRTSERRPRSTRPVSASCPCPRTSIATSSTTSPPGSTGAAGIRPRGRFGIRT